MGRHGDGLTVVSKLLLLLVVRHADGARKSPLGLCIRTCRNSNPHTFYLHVALYTRSLERAAHDCPRYDMRGVLRQT